MSSVLSNNAKNQEGEANLEDEVFREEDEDEMEEEMKQDNTEEEIDMEIMKSARKNKMAKRMEKVLFPRETHLANI